MEILNSTDMSDYSLGGDDDSRKKRPSKTPSVLLVSPQFVFGAFGADFGVEINHAFF